MELAKRVYILQKELPKEGVYALGDQIRRAVVSIPSNIAEGFGRQTDKDCKHFLYMARGLLYEAKTQLQLAEDLGFMQTSPKVKNLFDEVAKLINGYARSLTSAYRLPPMHVHLGRGTRRSLVAEVEGSWSRESRGSGCAISRVEVEMWRR